MLLPQHSIAEKCSLLECGAKMKKYILAATLMVAGMVSVVSVQRSASAEDKGEKPKATAGWIILEEDFWTPLRFEPVESLDSIRYHYRRNEEKAAANEIDKTVSWLRLAEGHAMPITKEKLTTAADELTKVAADLRTGKVAKAAEMEATLARAAQALGEWHYYKASESWGKNEEQDAGRDLAMAANYMQNAANSAHYQFGADTTEVITDYYKHGWWESETVNFDHNKLGKDLQTIEKAMKQLSEKLKKS